MRGAGGGGEVSGVEFHVDFLSVVVVLGVRGSVWKKEGKGRGRGMVEAYEEEGPTGSAHGGESHCCPDAGVEDVISHRSNLTKGYQLVLWDAASSEEL